MDHDGRSSPNRPSRSVARHGLARISPAVVRVLPASETGYARRWFYYILSIGIETNQENINVISIPRTRGRTIRSRFLSFCRIRMEDPTGGNRRS